MIFWFLFPWFWLSYSSLMPFFKLRYYIFNYVLSHVAAFVDFVDTAGIISTFFIVFLE